MGKTVNQGELAEIHGVTTVTIWEWQKSGMPVQARGERGEANEYDVAATIAWRIAEAVKKSSGGESLRDRLARLQGDELELKLETQRGALVPAAEIEPVWTTRVLSAAAFLMGEASRLAMLLDATDGIEAKRTLLKSEFATFLTHLGTEGERMQDEVVALLEKIAADEAQAFLARIGGHASTSGPAGPSSTSVGTPGAAGGDQAV